MERKKAKKIKIGSITIGGDLPVAVQSMTKTDTSDIWSTVDQIKQLEAVGCELIRVAVPNMESAKALKKIKKEIRIPLIADIHFDYKLALEAINQGVDKIRINPSNIGSKEKIKQIVIAAKSANIPIRIGINSGSLRDVAVEGYSLPEKMVNVALEYIKMFEDWDFQNIVLSVKASDVMSTIEAYRMLSKKTKYPLHLGITESGPPGIGTVKSAIGLGILLQEGIGDTIRVSLTASPVEEIKVAYYILQSLNLRNYGIDLISCPTCARCKINLTKIVNEFEKALATRYSLLTIRSRPIRVAIMGCEVNGPGEAKHADIGIAGGKNTGLLFQHGKILKKVKPEDWINKLITEIKNV